MPFISLCIIIIIIGEVGEPPRLYSPQRDLAGEDPEAHFGQEPSENRKFGREKGRNLKWMVICSLF